MMLVDSSVWIDSARSVSSEATHFLASRDESDELATTGVIVQEVLQGVASERHFEAWRDRFWGMLILEPRELSTYELAAQLFRRAKAKGLVIRKPTGCLIAALAIEHGALLVHNDRDFLALAQVEPALLVYPGRPH
jgi:predicted nucleic acid-binding protein